MRSNVQSLCVSLWWIPTSKQISGQVMAEQKATKPQKTGKPHDSIPFALILMKVLNTLRVCFGFEKTIARIIFNILTIKI